MWTLRSAAAPWLAHSLLAVVTAVLLQTLVLELGNTLHRNGRWISSKVDLAYGILGSVSFLTTRTALQRNRLDLGVWHGAHEILYFEPIRLDALAFDFRLRRSGYLVAVFNKSDTHFDGVRLSRDPDYPSVCLSGNAQGEFTGRRDLEVRSLRARWHHLELRAADGVYEVFLDGKRIGACGAQVAEPRWVGFRGSGTKKNQVDNVVIQARHPSATIRERFENRRHAGSTFGAILAGVFAVHAVVLAATRIRRRRSGVALHPYLATTHGVLLSIAVLLLAADWLYFWRLHPKQVDFHGYDNRIEGEGAIVARLEAWPRPKAPGVRRLLLVGGSQTWGSGAARAEETWAARLEAMLNAEAEPGDRYECIAAGIPAYTARRLYDLYVSDWVGLEPDVVVLDLGHNDRDFDEFEEYLEKFVAFNRAREIRTVFIPEPNNTESRKSLHKLHARHDRMRTIGRARGVTLIEMHQALVEQRDRGFLWWDRVHLTSYGHQLFAAELFAKRSALLGTAEDGGADLP
jgi:lysophospholipase L1-like esterase